MTLTPVMPMTTTSPMVQIPRDRCERVHRLAIAILFVFLVIAIYTSAELGFVSVTWGTPNKLSSVIVYIYSWP